LDYLPLFFQLNDRKALLVGGGNVALRKASLLVKAGANVTVVAHQICAELKSLVEQNGGQAVVGEYHAALLEEHALVIAATDDEDLNERVHLDATDLNLPVNVVDQPNLCTFVFPAVIDRSPIVVAVSSGGKSPVLARMLRAKLETWVPASYASLGELAGRYRDQVKARFNSLTKRRMFWEHILQGQVAEKVFAGRVGEAEELLQHRLEVADPEHQIGEVYLIGAGPGDPELLTFKALRLMQQADVVLYDALVSPQIVELCRRDADLIYVGKRRDDHTVPQQGINELLVEHAKQGRRVVRLKGGDPFIFGRGGEELQELARHGIPFQVVPGITAASACSTYAGIPLTHRDYAQSFKVVTGQLKNRSSELDFSELVAANQTLVFYMGLHTLPDLTAGLIDHGKPESTPAAIVSRGTRADQQVLIGTLADIADKQREAQLPAPGLIIVGKVVNLHEQLSWFGEDLLDEGNHSMMMRHTD